MFGVLETLLMAIFELLLSEFKPSLKSVIVKIICLMCLKNI